MCIHESWLKSDAGKLYHVILLAELERLKANKWFGLPSMQREVQTDAAAAMGAVDPNGALLPREAILKEVEKLQGGKERVDALSLIPELTYFYTIPDPDLYVKVMEMDHGKLLLCLGKLDSARLKEHGVDPAAIATIRNLVSEINRKYDGWKKMVHEFQQRLKAGKQAGHGHS